MNGDSLSFLAWFIPLCSIAAGVLIHAIRQQAPNKSADAAITQGQWQRLTDEITRKDAEIERKDAEIAASHEREAAANERANDADAYSTKLEAIMEGFGENRETAQILLAAQRLLEDQRKKRNGNGGHE